MGVIKEDIVVVLEFHHQTPPACHVYLDGDEREEVYRREVADHPDYEFMDWEDIQEAVHEDDKGYRVLTLEQALELLENGVQGHQGPEMTQVLRGELERWDLLDDLP